MLTSDWHRKPIYHVKRQSHVVRRTNSIVSYSVFVREPYDFATWLFRYCKHDVVSRISYQTFSIAAHVHVSKTIVSLFSALFYGRFPILTIVRKLQRPFTPRINN